MKKSAPKPEYKQKIVVGLSCIVAALVCIVGIFYFVIDNQGKRTDKIGNLEEQLVTVTAEKDALERKASDLESKVGRSLNLQKLVDEADKVYGQDEHNKKEGYLWIDRKSETMYVTLGALNGLTPGSRLTIYDGDNKKIGFVRVETPLDVISYVRLADKELKDLKEDYYKVVIE